MGACHHGHPSPLQGVGWGAAHCPRMGMCGCSCISMCACHGGALLTIDGLVVELILVYMLQMAVVMCGQLSHSPLWAVVLWACGCGGVHIVAGRLWAVVGFVIVGSCGVLVGGHSGCWSWSWVVVGLRCHWFVVIVAIGHHLCLWALVVCHCRWLLWAVIAVSHVGSHCWSLRVLLVVVVRRRDATSCCQTNVVCYSSQINNKQINNSTRIPFLSILGNIPVEIPESTRIPPEWKTPERIN